MSTRDSQPLPRFDAPEPVMRLAGAWLARRDRGFTAAEQNEFEAWATAHPSHAAAVAQLERTMTAFDRLQELAADSSPTIDPDAFAPPRRERDWFFPSLLAAGVAAALALAFWHRTPAPAPSSWHYATTTTGYERTVLPDGSTVELNANTIVDVAYTPGERTVHLAQGEAHFQVAKNPARPFVVNAHGIAFRAVGTAFDVRLNSASVEMLVTEGKVQVEDSPASSATAPKSGSLTSRPDRPLVIAGQRIVVPSARSVTPTVVAVTPEEIDRSLAWQTRVADFQKTPLRDVVAAFNRHNRSQIVIADPALEALHIGGNFRLDQPDAFVRLLETSFGVAAEADGEKINLRSAK